MRTKLAVQRSLHNGPAPRYRGTTGTLRRIFAEEGASGLFRGITPAVVSHAPAAALFFSTYSFLRSRVPDAMLPSSSTIPIDLARSSVSAGGAWAVTCAFLNPLFVLKTKQQTQLVRSGPGGRLKYVGLIPSLRVVLAEQGVRGLYAGTLAAMASSPGAMMQMPLYEYLKRATWMPHGTGSPAAVGPDGEQIKPSHSRVAIASACSASTVGMIMYPMEVVRLRLQAQGPSGYSGCSGGTGGAGSGSGGSGASSGSGVASYRGIVDCFKKMVMNEGVRSLYRGLGTGLIRTVPQSAIGLSCYETILRLTSSVLELMESQPAAS